MNPLVTFVIPAYNVEEYIEKCINSVREQSCSNIEIIVINDGSTDNTKELAEAIATVDSRVVVINNQNQGVSASRNNGIELARGKWIAFVDGDDYISEDFVEHMIEVSEETGAEFCMSTDCYRFKTDKQSSTIYVKRLLADDATALLLSPKVEVGCWNKLFLLDFINKYKLRFDTTLFYGEGLNFITSASQYSHCVGITNKKVYYYRQNNFESATKKFSIDKIINGWKALDCIGGRLDDKMVRSKKMLELHRFLFSFNAVRKIQSSETRSVYKSIYNYHISSIRKTVYKAMLSAAINWKYKLKIFIACITPWIIGVIDRKNKQNRGNKSV